MQTLGAQSKMETTFVTQLARVQTPRPRLLSLVGIDSGSDQRGPGAVRLVVQIRPRLLHYVQSGELMCVISSCEDICAVTECRDDSSPDHEIRIIVATAVGDIWLVQLPSTRVGLKPIQLKRQPDGLSTSARARVVAEVAGVQEISYIGAIDAVVCTSLLLPTTIVCDVTSQHQSKSELDELEGERSTCLVVLSAEEQRDWRGVISTAYRRDSSSTLVLQGDADGSVRLAVVDISGAARSTEELVRLSEPIHSLFPLNDGPAVLLVVGARGSIAIVFQVAAGHRRILRGTLGSSPKSIAILGVDQSTLVWSISEGKTFMLRIDYLIKRLHGSTKIGAEPAKPSEVVPSHVISRDVVSICATHTPINTLAILTECGRVFCLHHEQIIKDISASAHPLQNELPPTDVQVKHLLRNIGSVSNTSQKLRERSENMNELLNGLDSALQLSRVANLRGAVTAFGCCLNVDLVSAGWRRQTKRVRVRFTLQVHDSTMMDKLIASSMWRISIVVSIQNDRVSSYGFALSECVNTKQSILLDQGLLQKPGPMLISCELVFVPIPVDSLPLSETDSIQPLGRLESVVFPIIHRQQFHPIVLSEPAKEFPSNPSLLREQSADDLATGSQGHLWWQQFFHSADHAGVSVSANSVSKSSTVNPPVRFAIQISRCTVTESSEHDPAVRLEQEEVLRLFYRIMGIEAAEEREQWQSACRGGGGKWWIGMRTPTGNLVVLRFEAPLTHVGSPVRSGKVDVSIMAAIVPDLSAMRSLVLQSFAHDTESIARTEKLWNQNNTEDASRALSGLGAELESLTATMLDICNKAALARISLLDLTSQHEIEICQDEVLQILRRIADVESRTTQLYWRFRDVLNQHIAVSF